MNTSEKFKAFRKMWGKEFISVDSYNDILKEIEELEDNLQEAIVMTHVEVDQNTEHVKRELTITMVDLLMKNGGIKFEKRLIPGKTGYEHSALIKFVK